MRPLGTKRLLIAGLLILPAFVHAQDEQKQEAEKYPVLTEKEVYQLQKKTQALINVLVKKGIIDAETARLMSNLAEHEAAKRYGESTDFVPESQKDAPVVDEPGVVRVPYVSKHVRDQIREEVKKEIEADVTDAILEKAAEERWGVKDSWPAWLQKIRLEGDVRFRYEVTRFSDDNSTQYINANAINKAGGIIPAGVDALLNTDLDYNRIRLRSRLGVVVEPDDKWEMGIQIATGDNLNPVTQNITLGNSMSNVDFNLSKAYVAYGSESTKYSFSAGKFDNPWLHTDLVWDEDLTFQGLAASLSPFRSAKKNNGFDAFLTAGAFPLEHVTWSNEDKWLYAGQLGTGYKFESESNIQLAVAYYDFANVEGQLNDFGSELLDYTAPSFVQKGNTLFDIRNDEDNNTNLLALASKYQLVDVTFKYDIAALNPLHIILIADYVRNIGFDAQERLREYGFDEKADAIEENTDGYQLKFKLGHPEMKKRHDWSVSFAYKYLEGDAVLDAFTDSDFHLGGTDGAGYIIGANYGLASDVWFNARLLSSNEINGPSLGIDTWFFDLNARF